MSDTRYQSPISPGRAFYEDTVGERPRHPALAGDKRVDVLVIGGGFTGLSAALALAGAGVDVALVEAHRLGDGASGRNGGQFGTGQRVSVVQLEEEIGFERTKVLFDLAEEAKRRILDFATRNAIDVDYREGQLSLVHKARLLPSYAEEVDALNLRYDYPHADFMEARETAERLGSSVYHGGIRDRGTGHLNPMKLLVGLARVGAANGARLFENTRVTKIERHEGRWAAVTDQGRITADRILMATNAYGTGLVSDADAHIMPIRSFMAATEPLAEPARILPGGEAVDDSRFVVRYFRKSADDRLLFGGREAYARADGPIEPQIRRQIESIYPHLKNVRFSHAWGGSVAVTRTRMPYVRTPEPGLTVIGGFSGHGVLLSHLLGTLYAEHVAGGPDRLEAFRQLRLPRFPGGKRWRAPLLFAAMTWFSIRDRL